MKKIYSLNVIAYIQACTDLKPEIGLEEVDGKLIGYATFPEVSAVDTCIQQYHKSPWLRKFISIYKEIRDTIKALKGMS